MDIRPFRVDVPDAVLGDLRDRLGRARLLPDSPRHMRSGMTAAYLAELVASWRDFDWRARERWLNAHPQYTVELDGARVHFLHRRADAHDAPALLVMHGWPHTFAMQLDFADLLPDFHVVVPSFPGFAFSSPYAQAEMSERQLAATMHRLMTEVLGYERYVTYGEDVSANVNDLLASAHPETVQAIITTHAHFGTPEERRAHDEPEVTAFFARLARDHESEGAYGHVQATRPDTLAAALNDSPAGLVAWLVEKFVEWGDADTDVPAAVFIQRHEADYPEVLARDFYRDLRVFERLDRGGHFTVAERPHEMAERVRAFVATL